MLLDHPSVTDGLNMIEIRLPRVGIIIIKI